MRKTAYRTGLRVYQELGRELERHDETLCGLIRLALDELLADFPRLRELYHDHESRRLPISRKKLRIMERELADRMEMHRAARAVRFLSHFQGRIPTTAELTRRRIELRAMREQEV